MQRLRKLAGKRDTYVPDFFPPGLIHPVLLTRSAGGGGPSIYKRGCCEAWAWAAVAYGRETRNSLKVNLINAIEINAYYVKAVSLTLVWSPLPTWVGDRCLGRLSWCFIKGL